jgi:hypothetical protein
MKAHYGGSATADQILILRLASILPEQPHIVKTPLMCNCLPIRFLRCRGGCMTLTLCYMDDAPNLNGWL